MSIKRSGSPLESIARAQRVDDSSAAAASSQREFDRLPDELLDHIFSFLPKETCGAVSLVDRRFNHHMAEHYANRARLSLDRLFNVDFPRDIQSFAEEGIRLPADGSDMDLECKLLHMERQNQRLRNIMHEESIRKLALFKTDPSSVKGLGRVDAARSLELPRLELTPTALIDRSTGEVHPLEGTLFERIIRVECRQANTEYHMK